MPWQMIRGLPWRIILGIGLALLGIALIVIGTNRALDNARAAGRAEVQAKWNAEKAGAQKARAELSSALAEAFNGLDGSLQNTVRTLSSNGADITVRLQKEMANDPRYTSPDCSVSDRVRDEIDAARRLSGSPAVATVRDGGVPTSGAAVRLDLGGGGQR